MYFKLKRWNAFTYRETLCFFLVFISVAVRFVFDSSDECTIVHSALYSCLRAVFGLSVAGVLVAVFSCMLGNFEREKKITISHSYSLYVFSLLSLSTVEPRTKENVLGAIGASL